MVNPEDLYEGAAVIGTAHTGCISEGKVYDVYQGRLCLAREWSIRCNAAEEHLLDGWDYKHLELVGGPW